MAIIYLFTYLIDCIVSCFYVNHAHVHKVEYLKCSCFMYQSKFVFQLCTTFALSNNLLYLY